MLHHEKCLQCNQKNIYFDNTLKVSKQIEEDAFKVLEQAQKDLKMKNRANEGSLKSSRPKAIEEP